MSSVPTPITEEMQHYIAALLPEEEKKIQELLEESYKLGLPAIHISRSQARFMQVFLRAMNAKNVLEVGTLGGYSAAMIARSLPRDGKVITLELNNEYAQFAKRFCEALNVDNKVEIKIGPALETLAALKSDSYDFVFIDADKPNYENYLSEALRVVRVGGVIAADNALAFGLIANEDLPASDPDYPNVMALRKFNRRMANHPQLLTVLASIGDGMHLGVRVV